MTVLGELPCNICSDAFLDIHKNLLVAGFVADQQETQAVVLHDLECFVRNIGLCIARPGDTQLANFPGQCFYLFNIVSQRVIVEKKFLNLREVISCIS